MWRHGMCCSAAVRMQDIYVNICHTSGQISRFIHLQTAPADLCHVSGLSQWMWAEDCGSEQPNQNAVLRTAEHYNTVHWDFPDLFLAVLSGVVVQLTEQRMRFCPLCTCSQHGSALWAHCVLLHQPGKCRCCRSGETSSGWKRHVFSVLPFRTRFRLHAWEQALA